MRVKIEKKRERRERGMGKRDRGIKEFNKIFFL